MGGHLRTVGASVGVHANGLEQPLRPNHEMTPVVFVWRSDECRPGVVATPWEKEWARVKEAAWFAPLFRFTVLEHLVARANCPRTKLASGPVEVL